MSVRSILSSLIVSFLSATSIAAPPPDRASVLPCYLLPDSAKVDGDLSKWKNIPPMAPESIRMGDTLGTPVQCRNFAPSLRLGMKKGSSDLFLLVIVADMQRYYEARSLPWNTGDFLELYMDFGREARDRQHPHWQLPDKTKKANDLWVASGIPGAGQCGFRPATLAIQPKMFCANNARKWKFEYASVSVEGGTAYEIHIDGQSVLSYLGRKQLPDYFGFDLGFCDQDYPIVLRLEGYTNEAGLYRLFGTGMDHAWVNRYGKASLRPVNPPADRPILPPPKTLKVAFGEFPTADDVRRAIAKQPGQLADLVYWAGKQGAIFDADLVKALMVHTSPLVRENCLAVLYYTDQDKDAIAAGAEAVYGKIEAQQRNALILANLLNKKYVLGYRPQLLELIKSSDHIVAFSAARALARVGTAADIAPLQQTLADAKAAIAKRKNLRLTAAGYIRAYEVYMGGSLENLKARVSPITIPTATPVVGRLAENTDLPRLMPEDGNQVYNAKGLLRRWPEQGPKELWRVKIGEGKGAIVEANGRAFTVAQSGGKQWALCLDPLSGKILWRHVICDKGWQDVTTGPDMTPVIDGDRIYFEPKIDIQYNPISPLICLRAEDGTEIWHSDGSYFGQTDGVPLIVGDTLYAPAGRQGKGQILAAVNKKTGELLWGLKDPAGRADVYASAASPAYQIVSGIPQVICGVYHGAREVWGVNPQTGEVYWTYPTPMHHSLIASPVVVGSRVFICGGQGSAAFSACLQMYVKNGKIKARQVYRSETLQCNMYNTVAVVDGAVYGFSGNFIHCTRLNDGKLLWKKAGSEWDSECQLIIADGLIFALTNKNELVMLAADKKGYKELGRVDLNMDLGIAQQPTVANGRLYIRGKEQVVCYDLVNPQ